MAQETTANKDELTAALDKLIKKYGAEEASLEEVRAITARVTKKTGETLTQAVLKIREE